MTVPMGNASDLKIHLRLVSKDSPCLLMKETMAKSERA